MPVVSKENTGFDPSKYGAVEVPVKEVTTDFDPSKYGATELKKKSNLSVGTDGQLKQSEATTLPSELPKEKPKEPEFWLPNFKELSSGQRSKSDNTSTIQVQHIQNVVDETLHGKEKAEEKKMYNEKVLKSAPEALENTINRSLKIKGIKPTKNSAQYNDEKEKYTLEMIKGDAQIGFDENGKPGLFRTTGFLDNIASHYNQARLANQEADEFSNKMTDQQRLDYLKSKQTQKESTPYIGEKQSAAGSVGGLLGEQAPFMGKAVVGGLVGSGLAALAPETGGATAAVLPEAMAFIFTAHDASVQGKMSRVVSDFQILTHQHPEWTELQRMAKARESENLGMVQGLVTNALLMKAGKGALVDKPMVSSIVPNAVKDILKGAGKIAAVQGAADVADNLSGDAKRSMSDIAKDAATSFKENATVFGLLHVASGVVNKALSIPKYLHSVIKSELVKHDPVQIESALKVNEDAGNIPQGTTEKVMADLHDFKDAENKTPNGLSEESKASVAGLIQKRTSIEQEAETKDVTAQPLYKERIEAINNQISDIQRTNKPLEHEIDEATGETYKKPTFDNIAAMRVKNVADKISKGKELTDAEEIQAEHNFPDKVEAQLNKVLREEKSANKDKEKPNTEITDNIEKYLNDKSKETEKIEGSKSTEKTSVTDEGTNKTIQPTETTEFNPEEIKKITREPIPLEHIDTKVEIKDLNGNAKKVKAYEGRTELRDRLKRIDQIINCL